MSEHRLRSLIGRLSSSFAERRLPQDLAKPIATTADGRDITRPFIREIEEARDPHLAGAVDWGVYERIRQDDQVKSCMQQRISAVVSREWTVLPGDEEDPRSVAAAEAFTDQLTRIGWDQRTEKMLWATFYGVQVAELLWKGGGGLIGWEKIKVRHARRFRFDNQERLRLLTRANMTGEIMPERKFWFVRSGGTDDDTPYGDLVTGVMAERDTARAIAAVVVREAEPLRRHNAELQAANSRLVAEKRDLRFEMQAQVDAAHAELDGYRSRPLAVSAAAAADLLSLAERVRSQEASWRRPDALAYREPDDEADLYGEIATMLERLAGAAS